jgi:hypothetical protein
MTTARLQTCLDVARYLNEYDGALSDIAATVEQSLTTTRRAIRMLQQALPIRYIRVEERQRIDQWHMERKLEPGELEAVVVSLFLDDAGRQNLLRRAKVEL